MKTSFTFEYYSVSTVSARAGGTSEDCLIKEGHTLNCPPEDVSLRQTGRTTNIINYMYDIVQDPGKAFSIKNNRVIVCFCR